MSKSYTPQPEVPESLQERYRTILRVLNGELTVSAAATSLGLSRNQFQTVMHKALLGMIEALEPRPPGPQPTPEKERQLAEENERLSKENEKLRQRVETIDRLMGVASGILRGNVRTRSTKTKKKSEGGSNEPEEPDPVCASIAAAKKMKALGLSAPLAAAIVGTSAATLRRWKRRMLLGVPPRLRRGARKVRALSAQKKRELSEVVRKLHGICGADSLRHSVEGVSRRQAAAVKRETLREMERERVERCTRLRVAQPGVMRSIDQIYVGQRTALIASDASVPYRTTARVVAAYDGEHVARTLEEDLRTHGTPLVYRMDRASCHRVPQVRALLEANGVLLLHGPPRYPQFYGQHERQNRDHRAWLGAADLCDELLREMLNQLNRVWRRRSLGWQTPAEVWSARQPLEVDRRALREEVARRAAHLAVKLRERTDALDLAERLAIEQALEHRGLMSREAGGWC
jgi:hypothetical protein